MHRTCCLQPAVPVVVCPCALRSRAQAAVVGSRPVVIPGLGGRRMTNRLGCSPALLCRAKTRCCLQQRLSQAAAAVTLSSVVLLSPLGLDQVAVAAPATLAAPSMLLAAASPLNVVPASVQPVKLVPYTQPLRFPADELRRGQAQQQQQQMQPPPVVGGHKALWPMEWRDIAGFTTTAVALALAASSGIGGGSLLILIYMLIFGFETGAAVALSNLTILGGAITNFAFNVGRRHPVKRAPLIDWDLILLMEPSTILGALAGSYANHVLPPWLTHTLVLSPVLCYATGSMLQRGVRTYRLETLELEALQGAAAAAAAAASKQLPDSSAPRFLDAGLMATAGGSVDGSANSIVAFPNAYASKGSFAPAAAASSMLAAAGVAGPLPYSGGSSPGPGMASGPHAPALGGHSMPAAAAAAAAASGGMLGQVPGGWAVPASPPPLSPPPPAGFRGLPNQPAAPRIKLSGDVDRVWVPEVPAAKLGVLVALLAGVVVSDSVRASLPCPSSSYWLATLAMVPVTLAVLFGVHHHLVKDAPSCDSRSDSSSGSGSAGSGTNGCCGQHQGPGSSQEAVGADATAAAAPAAPAGEVVWTHRNAALYPAMSTVAGLVAGMVGVGGGIIKGPLMLELGVNPLVAAATSATMILFTSASASVVFVAFGDVQWDYAAALFCCGVGFTALGQVGAKWVMERMHGRTSVIVFAMAAVLGVSTVVLGVEGLLAAAAAFEQHRAWAWGSLCGAP